MFGKITVLTSHIKICHTKWVDIESGNAVNYPLLTVKHFFCHCSICGNGNDGYPELSVHENKEYKLG